MKDNENDTTDRRVVLNRLQNAVSELEKVGVVAYIANAYGAYKPSTFIIVEGTKIEDGNIREVIDG